MAAARAAARVQHRRKAAPTAKPVGSAAACTMRAALADDKLLGTALVGNSWIVWRAFLIALVGETLTRSERRIFYRFTRRKREPGRMIEEALFLIGRRGGKDRAVAVLAAYLSALVDWSTVLAPGERGLVLIIAADTRQALVQRNYIEGVFDGSPLLSKLVTNKTADSIEFSNGIYIEVRAASFRRLRGVTCVAVIASEAAFWMDETSANADVEILNAVRPTLATTGGPLVVITTPYAQRGVVFDTYRRHYGADGDPLVLVAQGATRDFNPTLPASVVDRAMERDAAAATAEYMAQFRVDIEAFVGRDVVEAAVVVGRRELAPVAGVSYVAFVDPSGGSQDAMTLAVAHLEGNRAVVDVIRERRPPFSPDDVVAEFCALLKAYGVSSVRGDRYAGEWPRERFRVHGVGYEPAAAAKSEIYRDMLPVLNAGKVELLDNPHLAAQLCGLERRTARGGRDSIDHQPGGHDDLINSVAGVVVALVTTTGADAWVSWAGDQAERAQVDEAPVDDHGEQQRFYLPGNPNKGLPPPEKIATNNNGATSNGALPPGMPEALRGNPVSLSYFSTAAAKTQGGQGWGGASGLQTPKCIQCGKPAPSRISDGVRVWCDVGCQHQWTISRSAAIRAREVAINGGLPLTK